MQLISYQAHRAVTQPSDMWSILAELGSRKLGLASDLANDLLYFVHGVAFVGRAISVIRMVVVG